MTDLPFVSALVQADLPVWEQCLQTEFLQKMENGILSEDCFKSYLVEDSLYLREYAKIFAWGMTKATTMAAMRTYYSLLSFVQENEDLTRLRYLEQYGNHYIAFRLLAVLRDRIFTKLRALCPAKLESRQKGSLLTMITADIETLEVFYAHTVSPVCIAVLVSAAVMVVTGLAASWYLSLIAAAAYLCIGVLLPRFFSRRMAETGMRYRRELGDFGAYFLDSIKGIRELVLYNAGEARAAEVDRRSDAMLGRTKALKRETALSTAATEAAVSLSVLAVLAVGILLVHSGSLSAGRMVLGVTAVFGSFGPVIAVSALPANLNQTFASGERILRLLEEQPEVRLTRFRPDERKSGGVYETVSGIVKQIDLIARDARCNLLIATLGAA